MKGIWKKLILVLCAVLIMGTLSTPVLAGDASVTGGASRAAAKAICKNKNYVTTIRSSQTYSIFKFKTYSYRAHYEMRLYNVSVARPINVYLRGTDGVDAGTASGTKNLVKGDDCCVHTAKKSLKASSWYYIIIKNSNRRAGRIRFRVNVAKDLEGNTMSVAKRVTVSKNYYGTHTFPLDQDYFAFKPATSGNYRVVVKNTSDECWIRSSVMNGSGSILKKKDYYSPGKYMSVVVSLLKTRTYYIHVQSGNEEWTDSDGSYKIFIQKR